MSRFRRALLCLPMALTLAVPLQASPAQAEPPQEAGALSYTGELTVDDTGKLTTRPQLKADADEPDLTYRDPFTTAAASVPRKPPAEPGGPEVEDCLNSDDAKDSTGRVYNRFMWCQRYQISAGRVVAGRLMSTVTMDFDAVAYGRDDANRGVTVFFKAGDAVYWPTTKGYIRPESMLLQRISCLGAATGCEQSYAHTGKQLKDWDDGWTSWSITSLPSVGTDQIAKHTWAFDGFIIDSWNTTLPGLPAETHNIRCDSAVYFGLKRRGACIFDDVIPHLQYSVQKKEVADVAKHIACAQAEPFCLRDGQPWQTYPKQDTAKIIPGKFIPGRRDDQFALHRVPYDGPVWKANGREKDRGCATIPKSDYDTSKGQECDEYPFATTVEGASNPNWDYSVLGVPKTVNGCAGNALKRYYRDDRILYHSDGFYVHIKDTPPENSDACEAIPADEDEPADGGGPAPVNLPPSVDAGPDISGDEGAANRLQGNASDPESGTPHVSWSFTPGPGVDPGATCGFGDASAGGTTVTCTDDGTFTVTLTASDGHNAPVSDSATVRLSNVAPHLGPRPVIAADDTPDTPPDTPGIHQPQPWQVFRAGTPVKLQAVFGEPGANDTHTCVTDWDDGTASTYNAADLTCENTHTFTEPGMYTIKTKVTDDDTGTGTKDVLVIVYDPDAGFATAGGWLAAADGKAHVQFNPKYLPHDEGPAPGNGKLSYRVKDGLDLDSASLEWLVVTRSDKIALKGSTSDGRGFVAYAYDGSPDRFRLVVWPLSAGAYPQGEVSYDNVAGAGYDLDEARPVELDQGSIQAHN
ncbi:hypothetical protein GCM10023334_094350 [Nonomuraea thailandensis]